MRLSTWIAVILVLAGLGDGLASSAIALCRPAPSQAACCCGSRCAKDAAGPGMRSACCDMQRAPLRGAETSARNTAPSAPTLASAVFAAMIPLPSS